jgi:hypothetical protein
MGAWVLHVSMLNIIGCVLCISSTVLTVRLGKQYNTIFLKYTILSQLVASLAQACFPAFSTDTISSSPHRHLMCFSAVSYIKTLAHWLLPI